MSFTFTKKSHSCQREPLVDQFPPTYNVVSMSQMFLISTFFFMPMTSGSIYCINIIFWEQMPLPSHSLSLSQWTSMLVVKNMVMVRLLSVLICRAKLCPVAFWITDWYTFIDWDGQWDWWLGLKIISLLWSPRTHHRGWDLT